MDDCGDLGHMVQGSEALSPPLLSWQRHEFTADWPDESDCRPRRVPYQPVHVWFEHDAFWYDAVAQKQERQPGYVVVGFGWVLLVPKASPTWRGGKGSGYVPDVLDS